MPRMDGTGPLGQGPRTGRGWGNCPGIGGSGYGFGRGFGRFCSGCPFWNNQQITKEDQRKLLEEEKKAIEKEIAELGE